MKPISFARNCLVSFHGLFPPGGVLFHFLLGGDFTFPIDNDEKRCVFRVFIPTRLSDNRILIEKDPNYINRLKSSGPPWLVRAWLEGDWDAEAGESLFAEKNLLVDGLPVEFPHRVNEVYAVIDTALKDTVAHDGTAVVFFARRSLYRPIKLFILDWDVLAIQAALLETWLPSIHDRLEGYARTLSARRGNLGSWVEDKGSGTVLLQQARLKGYRAQAIDPKITQLGKEGRAFLISGKYYQNEIKITRPAFDKVSTWHGETRNHFPVEICGFRIGQRTPHQLDLLDCFTSGVAIGLVDRRAFR